MNEQQKEALNRMVMLNMSRQCINAFKRGEVWESEGIGALYECNDKEKQYIAEFEKAHDAVVYHMIHNITEFGELYTMLFVSKYKSEWTSDRYDLEDGYALAYVKNITAPECSEFGSVGIRPSIGGLVRTA